MRFNLSCFRTSTEDRIPEYMENDGKAIGMCYRTRSVMNDIQLDSCGDEIRDKLKQLFAAYKYNDQSMVTNDCDNHVTGTRKSIKKFLKSLKLCSLIGLWIAFSAIFVLTDEKEIYATSHCINRFKSVVQVSSVRIGFRVGIMLEGDFTFNRTENDEKFLLVQLQSVLFNKSSQSLSEIWKIPIEYNENSQMIVYKNVFVLSRDTNLSPTIQVMFTNPFDKEFSAQLIYDAHPIDTQMGIIYGVILVVGMYVLIIWDIVHRTFAALLGSTMAIAFLAVLDNRPSMSEIMSWIDIETLLLLFGMMTLVAILSDTGIFDYMAVYAYRISKGDIWLLIIYLATFTAILSALLDNATTLLLMGPVVIRLCQLMELNPISIMTIMVCFSNIGGALTPVGDPPNIIIVSNSDVIASGIDFPTFVLHMSFGVLAVCLQTYLQFRYIKFRRMEDLRSAENSETKSIQIEIDLWEKVKSSFQSSDDDQELAVLRNATNVQLDDLKKKLQNVGSKSQETFQMILDDLEQKYPIRDKVLLFQSSFCLFFVLSLFFLHFIPQLQRLSLGWTSLIGAFLLLILIDTKDIDAVVGKVEWSTLLFFSGLFIVIEALTKLGLIDSIGEHTKFLILSAPPGYRLAVAIIIIVWVSAIASAFFDNIPITTMMIKIVTKLAANHQLGLPLKPLIWALSFGACLGGNGTLIGASANVICAGVAEKHGYKFTFMEFFKIGFPMMIVNVTIATIYLTIAHVFFEWH